MCGACAVLVDGRPLSACLLPAVHADGTDVVTVEDLAGGDGSPSPLQEAFIRHGGFQCGICTPGQRGRRLAAVAGPHAMGVRSAGAAEADVVRRRCRGRAESARGA